MTEATKPIPNQSSAIQPPGGGDDRELLRLCSEFQRQHAIVSAIVARDDGDPDDDLGRALNERQVTEGAIEEITATTLPGVIAKAGVAVVMIEEEIEDRGGDPVVEMALSTLRDVAGSEEA